LIDLNNTPENTEDELSVSDVNDISIDMQDGLSESSQEEIMDTIDEESETNNEDQDDGQTSVLLTEDEPRYNLRPSRERSYNHRLDHQMDQAQDTKTYDVSTSLLHKQKVARVVTRLFMTQMSAVAGIKNLVSQQ
jgi:hypothetical protein